MSLFGSVSTALAKAKISFNGNIAEVAGGAVYVSGADVGPESVGTSFVSNSANMGGGVYTTGSGIAVIPNTLGIPERQDTFMLSSCEFIRDKGIDDGRSAG